VILRYVFFRENASIKILYRNLGAQSHDDGAEQISYDEFFASHCLRQAEKLKFN
jgi:hypothetical protein